MEIKQYIEDILPTATSASNNTRISKLHITASGGYREIKWLEKKFNDMLANPIMTKIETEDEDKKD